MLIEFKRKTTMSGLKLCATYGKNMKCGFLKRKEREGPSWV